MGRHQGSCWGTTCHAHAALRRRHCHACVAGRGPRGVHSWAQRTPYRTTPAAAPQHPAPASDASGAAGRAPTPDPRAAAARSLLSLAQLINQAVGDALSNLLLVLLALRRRGWGLAQWAELYSDLPSRQSVHSVPDRTVIKTQDAERSVSSPSGLQSAITVAVARVPNGQGGWKGVGGGLGGGRTRKRKGARALHGAAWAAWPWCGGPRLWPPRSAPGIAAWLIRSPPFPPAGAGRAFVRPSGTEDVVRVYAEAATQPAADALAGAVGKLVVQFCGGRS